MLPQYFVVYTGNLDADPLDKGCESFLTREGADAFISVLSGKGYSCHLFSGEWELSIRPSGTVIASKD